MNEEKFLINILIYTVNIDNETRIQAMSTYICHIYTFSREIYSVLLIQTIRMNEIFLLNVYQRDFFILVTYIKYFILVNK